MRALRSHAIRIIRRNGERHVAAVGSAIDNILAGVELGIRRDPVEQRSDVCKAEVGLEKAGVLVTFDHTKAWTR